MIGISRYSILTDNMICKDVQLDGSRISFMIYKQFNYDENWISSFIWFPLAMFYLFYVGESVFRNSILIHVPEKQQLCNLFSGTSNSALATLSIFKNINLSKLPPLEDD